MFNCDKRPGGKTRDAEASYKLDGGGVKGYRLAKMLDCDLLNIKHW